MSVKTFSIDGKDVSAEETTTILEAARENGIEIPTLCHMAGISVVGACRLCMVEIEGSNKLQAACVMNVAEDMVIHTDSPRLREYRQMIVELLFAEGNHICSVCVANGNCELQEMARSVGMDHCRFEYTYPKRALDLSHRLYGLDHNRCILCTRCVRTCDEIEGAHTLDMAGRGLHNRVIAGLNQPWGQAESCTSCGKCVQSCPTGALFRKGSTVAEMNRDQTKLEFIVTAREKKQWRL
jgi:bidirectional [NiFe] hydrogenase diaphorase subunit